MILCHIRNYKEWDVDPDIEDSKIPLSIPEECPSSLKNLFRKCWQFHPEDRYSFKDIVLVLQEEYTKISKSLDQEPRHFDSVIVNESTGSKIKLLNFFIAI